MPTDAAPVSWSHTSAESRLLRACVSLPAGVVAAGALAVAVGTVGLVGLLFVRGEYALGAAMLLAVGVAALRIAPFHYARLRQGLSLDGAFRGLGPQWVAAGAVVGATAFGVGAQFGTAGLAAALVATVLLPVVLAAVLTSEDELRPDDGTLTYRGSDIELAAVAGVRRVALGGYVAYRFSYAPGAATFSTPRLVVVSGSVAPEIDAAVERGIAADADPGSPKRAVRAAAGALGVFFLGFAGFLLTVEPATPHPRGRGVLWYAAIVTAGFGVLFVGVGLRGG